MYKTLETNCAQKLLPTDILLVHEFLDLVVLLDDLWRLGNSLPQDMPLNEIRQPDLQFVTNKLARRNREDLCQKQMPLVRST